MKAIRTEAQLTSFRSRSDGGVGFSGVTPEMSAEEKCALFDLQNLLVEIVVFPKDEKDPEMITVKSELECKTPSQRLRGIIFKHFDQMERPGDFESFYRQRMDAICEGYKAKNLTD